MDPSPIPLTVAEPFGGQRLDVFLASRLPDLSRARVRKLIDGGRVEAGFPVKAVKANLLVAVGQTFRVTLPPPEPTHLPAQPLRLDLLFEDPDLLVINKPAGLVVHPGAGNPDHTLLNALVAHCPQIQGVGGVNRPGLVHRLDKDTSGLLVVAKSDLAFKGLVRELKSRHLKRVYLGLVKGRLEGKGKVDAPLGRHPAARNKMGVRADGGKEAVTRFESIRAGEAASLLMFKLETGRTHQIRVHAQFIKHPIWSDPVYGTPEASVGRQMLHAFRLTFRHPRSKETLSFLAPPPEDFIRCARELGLGVDFPSLDWKDEEAAARPRKKT